MKVPRTSRRRSWEARRGVTSTAMRLKAMCRHHGTVARETLERSVLLAPDAVARAAARFAADREQRWMLLQPRSVRASFAAEALGRGELAEQVWMLRQPDDVRERYIRQVLLAEEP